MSDSLTSSQLEEQQISLWRQACQSVGASVNDIQVEQFKKLYSALLAYNAHTNLTRLTSPHDYLYRHLLDSMTLLTLMPENASVVDLGSGAGFPAIPLALLRTDCQVLAVESVGKKCQFISEAKELLALKNLTVSQERAEVLGQSIDMRGQFDVVMARALAALPILLEYAIPLLKTGGILLAMKGASYQEELTQAQNALAVLNAELKEVHTCNVSELSGAVILSVIKTSDTPAKYPRQPGTPSKKPL